MDRDPDFLARRGMNEELVCSLARAFLDEACRFQERITSFHVTARIIT
jgi:hypothetical protein